MKADHFLLPFIEQPQSQHVEACPDRYRFDGLKCGNLFVALLQIVIGYVGSNVMDVVQVYVARKPLENFW